MRRAAATAALAAAIAVLAGAGPKLAGVSHAASFNCAQAATRTDRAICADPALSALDSSMAAAYGRSLARGAGVRQEQRAWLVARNQGCGGDRSCLRRFISARLAALQAGPMPTALPVREGACARTVLKAVETRLEDTPGSGSVAEEANTGYQVSYDVVTAIEQSRPGDPLIQCLVSIPRNCPEDDARGKVYAVANLRTLKGWSLPDSEHSCGGA
ncbi:MAG: lysozyme inhibitor LprI family protein [Caulobacterales bacterium]